MDEAAVAAVENGLIPDVAKRQAGFFLPFILQERNQKGNYDVTLFRRRHNSLFDFLFSEEP